MNIGFGMSLSGHIRIEKRGSDGEVNYRSEFNNLVLDVGWSNLISRTSGLVPQYLALGTGTTEPVPTDTGLEAVSPTLPLKQRSALSYGGSDPSIEMASAMQTFEYAQGEAEGVWTELGLSFDSAYSSPYNRSLVRDDQGNPISLTILSDEYLTVYVEIRMYISTDPVTGTLDYNGTTHNWSARINPGKLTQNDDNTQGNNIWKNGLVTAFAYSFGGVADDSLVYKGSWEWETFAQTFPPGSSKTLSSINFQKAGYYWQSIVSISIDPAISVPADHQLATGVSSIKFVRDTVPVT